MKYSPWIWLAVGALACWWLFGRRVTATVGIGDGVQVGRWKQVDPIGDVTAAGDTTRTGG